MTEEEKAQVVLFDEPLFISYFCERLNAQIDTDNVRKCPSPVFGKWLLDKGFLEIETIDGKEYKKASIWDESIGISSRVSINNNAKGYTNAYNREAQQFLLENLEDIITFGSNKKG